jgi:predicted  nucleic acid-binding Zn-ribbon protein
LAIPTFVELILIATICGLIAISVYILYLVDKLLSRVEGIEGRLTQFQPTGVKPEELEETLKRTTASYEEQLGKINEILSSTGKDIDSINSRIASYARDMTAKGEKLENLEKFVSGSAKETAALRREIAVITEKLEQLEKETNLLANMQQLAEEF